MKKLILLVITITTITLVSAQSPEAFKYQAIARDNTGKLIRNSSVSFRISILDKSSNTVYSETFSTTTNSYGLVTLNIGTGTVKSGDFSKINWSKGSYFIQTEMDPSGGANYVNLGTTQLLSVPYALYSKSSGNPPQTLSFSNGDLSISEGNTVQIPDKFEDGDVDPANELQIISLSNDTLYLENGGWVFLGNYLDNTDKQILSISGDSVSISNGNTIVINDDIDDADHDSKNELQTLYLSGDTLYISKGNSVQLPYPIPSGTCVQSPLITPPAGYTYSGDSFVIPEGWKGQITPLSFERQDAGAMGINGKIYLIAGRIYSSQKDVRTLEVYDPATKTWSKLDSMTYYRNGPSCAALNSKIYGISGSGKTQGYTAKCEVYDVTTNTWSGIRDYPLKLNHHSVVASGNNIYVAGGHDVLGLVKTACYMYNPNTNTWTSKANMPSKRYGAASAEKDGTIYLFGGSSGTNYLSSAVKYNTKTNKWTSIASMPGSRRYAAAAVLDDKIYVFGGSSASGVQESSVYIYDVGNDSWSTGTAMPDNISVPAVTELNGSVYVIGGNSDGKSLKTAYVLKGKKYYYLHCKN